MYNGSGGSREFNLPRRPPNFSAWTSYHDFQLPLEAALFWRTANGQPSRFPPWGKDGTTICATAPSSLSQEDEANIPVTLRQTWVPAPSRYSFSPLLEVQLGLLGHHKQGVMPALAALTCPFMPLYQEMAKSKKKRWGDLVVRQTSSPRHQRHSPGWDSNSGYLDNSSAAFET